MRILFAAYEASPFYKVGGLGDVAGSLPLSLARTGVRVTLVLPGYSFLKLPKKPEKLTSFFIEFDKKQEKVDLWRINLNPKADLCIIKHPLLSEKHKGEKVVYEYVFFSKAIAEMLFLKKFGKFDLVHLNDWHTSLVAYFLSKWNKNLRIPTILTIHNHFYQGMIKREKLAALVNSEIENGEYTSLLGLGISQACQITTVSPTFAREIIYTRLGGSLRNLFHQRRDSLKGILNGIDYQKWNPQEDAAIYQKYSLKNFSQGKTNNKIALQKELKLPQSAFLPLVSFIGRLDPNQKGIDLIYKAVPDLLRNSQFQFVLLGTGDEFWAGKISELVRKYPKKFVFINKFDEDLSRKIYASSDIILIPSKYEPCGLVQMIAMRYGTLPLVRRTGGLADTVKDEVNGFVFENYSATELTRTLRLALKLFWENPSKIAKMRLNAMREDFSWDKSAYEYKKLYQKIIMEKRSLSNSF